MEKLMVYLPHSSPRAEYIFTLMIRDLMGAEMVITSHYEEYFSYSGPRLEYGEKSSGVGIFIRSWGLLSEKTIQQQPIQFIKFKGYPAFFAVFDESSAFPFDVFSAAFYLVSRYEEYLPFAPDRYGRFQASASTAAAGKFLEVPILNIWADSLKAHILKVYPSAVFHIKKFRFIPSVDIDHAFAYRQRALYRILGGFGRSLLKGNMKDVLQRSYVLSGLQKDPYDQYEYIRAIHSSHGFDPFYFVLFADYGKDDNNVSLSGKAFQHLIRALHETGILGIHPSLTSGKDPTRLATEIKRLSSAVDGRIRTSRQHFLKVAFPGTYRQLIAHGITDDFSMGYASATGFRAGIADPFPFFDLSVNRSEPLVIHPVAVMDVTMKDYGRLSPQEAIALCRSVAGTIKSVNGEFVSVWHNESFDESGRWKGWRQVYEDLLATVSGLMSRE